jgi:hypothetical protein
MTTCNTPDSAPLDPGREAPKSLPALRVLAVIGDLVLCGFLLLLTLWATAALYFDFRVPSMRTSFALAYFAVVLAFWIAVKRRWLAATLTFCAFALVLGGWLSLKPSNDRDWQPDLKTLADAEIDGDKVVLHNVRNCDYRTETDFDVRYYDKTVSLNKIRTADLIMVYWGSPHMAHTMVSFGFEGGEYVCFSIETRKEKGEGYSAIKGLFRQFELIYIVADERDVVRLRTNYRPSEEAYLYRLRCKPDQVRELFLSYLGRINGLRHNPEWYSAITHNCTTSIRMQRAASERAPWDWRMLANGHSDTLLYERGIISTNIPLSELKLKCHINARAKAADKAEDFSQRIREGLPGMPLQNDSI